MDKVVSQPVVRLVVPSEFVVTLGRKKKIVSVFEVSTVSS
jgi:hypothetical protein